MELKDWRMQCRLRPYPHDVFRKFLGAPHREGQLVSVLYVSIVHVDIGELYSRLQRRYGRLDYDVQCAFEPYSDEHILVSRNVYCRLSDETQQDNEGLHYHLCRMSASNGHIATSYVYSCPLMMRTTAFSRNGRYIAWPLTPSKLCIFDCQLTRTQEKGQFYICSAFSPCGTKIAMMKCSQAKFIVDIMQISTNDLIETIEITGAWWRFSPFFRNFNIEWSKCKNYIGVTYRGSLKIINFNYENRATQELITPLDVGYVASLVSPQAFDICSRAKGTRGVIAFASQMNELFLFRYDQQRGLGRCLAQRPPLTMAPLLVTNCLRFSNTQKLLAVAMSCGEIFLLCSATLELLRCLQRVNVESTPFTGFSSIKFSCTDWYLTAGSDDGFARVWCVRRMDSLKKLCRRAIRSMCKMDDMRHLPLQDELLKYLTAMGF